MGEREQWARAIAALEAQRSVLGDAVVEAMITAARQQMASLGGREAGVSPPAERRRQVTVLFADISGFTEMAAAMDPEDVHAAVNALWQEMDAIIAARGGTIDKHMGDAVLALWGDAAAHEDDPEQAIEAALDMLQKTANWAWEIVAGDLDAAPSSPVQLRIGIHTGPVLLGHVGATAEYTAIGDTVNVANRLQQAAPAGHLLISHDTYRHVRGVFDVRPLEPLIIRGRRELLPIYLVERAKPRAMRLPPRGVEGIETRMIGRQAELRHLQEALETVAHTGRMRCVTVVGEAGVGKSRLLYEFSAWVELLPQHVRFFRGRTDPQLSQRPYDLIRDILAFRFEILETDSAAVAREKMEQSIAAFMGPEGVEKAHFIGHLVGFDFSGSPYLQGILDDARQIRDRALHYLAQFFAAVTEEQPAALLLEDVHWADRGALDMVDYLLQTCVEMPLLVVCLARSALYERRPAWGQDQPHHTTLQLQPLSEDDSGLLVAEILRKVPHIPAELRDLVVARAEGNPFFIEEVIKVLIEDGVIVKGDGAWQVQPERLGTVGVPQTLTGVIQTRLDHLAEVERETLQRASAVGQVFWDGAIAYMAQEPREAIRRLLGQLADKELVIERKASTFVGEREYVFKHVFLREVIYEGVLKRQRPALHTQVAAWVIEQSGERVAEHAGLIGSHYERAGEMALASEWYRRAGRQAQDAYAPETAITYYQKALVFLPVVDADTLGTASRRLSLYEGLGDALGRLGRYGEAAAAYQSMRETSEVARDAAAQARAWERLAWVQCCQGDHHVALESAERAVGWAGAARGQPELSRTLLRKGQILLEMGNTEAAAALGKQALEISTTAAARREMGRSLNLLGAVHWTLGQHEEATRYMEKALAVHRKLGNHAGVASTLNDLALTAQLRGDCQAAVPLYEDALAIFRQIGHREGEVACLSNLGGARVGLGDYASAEVDLCQVLERAESSSWFLSETHSLLAEAYLGQGKMEQATVQAQQALAIGQEIGQPEFAGRAWRALGMVAAQSAAPIAVGDLDPLEAADCFARALAVFDEMGAAAERARTLRAWARHELRAGDPQKGRQMWQEALETFTHLGMALEVEGMAQWPVKE